MDQNTTFDSTKDYLQQFLNDIRSGKLQLPDFQRGWVWDDEHISSLLASISLSYPIGAVMLLETGNPDVNFKPRLVEGLTLTDPPLPERLILDGQQRLTSLHQALNPAKPVTTRDARKKVINRWYYIDIEKTLDPYADREDAIISLPEDRITRNFRGEVLADYSSRVKECAAGLFPLVLVFDSVECDLWMMEYVKGTPEEMAAKLQRWSQFKSEIVHRFQQYQIPLITLKKKTPKEAVCQVFEKVNTGGVSLTVFELLTATFAVDNFNLRDDWREREARLRKYPVLYDLSNDDFLQAITLLATRKRRIAALQATPRGERAPGISCKRRDILRLSLNDYNAWAEAVTHGFELAARLLTSQKIFAARDLPYRTQLTPMAAILAVLGNKAEEEGIRSRLVQWYWCGVFGELYGSAIETRFAKDLPEVLEWLNGGAEPSTVTDANFTHGRLLSLRTRNSAAYKGVYALLLRDGCCDFRSGESIIVQTYFDDNLDIHHIFPKVWCDQHGVDNRQADSIVNKTAIAAKTNRMIGGNAPSLYIDRLQQNAGIDQVTMDIIFTSHAIDTTALRADDFATFYARRSEALLSRIGLAMGKVLSGISAIALQDEGEIADNGDEPDIDNLITEETVPAQPVDNLLTQAETFVDDSSKAPTSSTITPNDVRPESMIDVIDAAVKSSEYAPLFRPRGKLFFQQVYDILRQVAHQGGYIAYSELGDKLKLNMGNAYERYGLAFLLGEISKFEHRHGHPLLSVIVVHKRDPLMPGTGFFELAQSVNCFDGNDQDRFFYDELNRAHDHWRKH